jgi:hypothetical protein
MNGGNRPNVMSTPLARPHDSPTARASTTRHGRRNASVERQPERDAGSARTEPTDRSIPLESDDERHPTATTR